MLPFITIGLWNPFSWIGDFMSQALRFIHSTIGLLDIPFIESNSWGITIIVLTLLIRLLLHPLNKKQMDSMKAMQEVQPELEKIKKKYKDDQQTQQMKMMELYKEKGINPAAGCLPLLLQMPLLIALYQSIRGLAELEHASFLWLDSLTQTGDIALIAATGLVSFGQSFLQQKMTSGNAPGNQNSMMMFMMPLIIIFIGRSLPAGVLLYWFTSTLVMTIQQLLNYREPVSKGEAN